MDGYVARAVVVAARSQIAHVPQWGGGGGHRCDHSKCLHKTVGSIGRGMSVLLNAINPMGRHYVCADSMLLLERLVCVCVCVHFVCLRSKIHFECQTNF